MQIEIEYNNLKLIAQINDKFEIISCKSSHGIDFIDILLEEEKQLILDKAYADRYCTNFI